MSWPISTYRNLKQKLSGKFLIVFSLCSLTVAGVVWACADGGEEDYSAFAPEIFVAKQYTPFFYDSYYAYYGSQGEGNYEIDNSNNRYNEKVVTEWFDHYNHQFAKESLQYLLLKASAGGVDSIYHSFTGALKGLPAKYPAIRTGALNKNQVSAFFNCLRLAKASEKFTVNNEYFGWDKVKPSIAPAKLEPHLLNAFTKETDPFIKQRLWFQLVRYYYFLPGAAAKAKSLAVFNKYRSQFPKNLTYYRAMGYVAGYFYHRKNYALSNYLYSLCYDYSYEMKVPSKWSFHPQNETDWQGALKMAKNADEKITLWHMLGMQYDAGRAIRAIVAINPKSDKLDLLLSRAINIREDQATDPGMNKNENDSLRKRNANDRLLVENIANKNNTAKPYYWNLAAGYLNFIDSNYVTAGKYYTAARKQFPLGDKMVVAQGKLLDIWLYVKNLKKIDAKTEDELVEPLNWLLDPKKGIPNPDQLRVSIVLTDCERKLARLYHKQNDPVKEVCFANNGGFYMDSVHVQKLIDLLNKPDKTPFEKAMMKYYPYKVNDLYYHQATMLAYQEETDKAIAILQKRTPPKDEVLPGNPFTSRLIDCHDCDHAEPQKQKFTPLRFLQTMQAMQLEIKAGKNLYRNNYMLANAWYNITFYGNARYFYESDITGGGDVDPTFIDHNYRDQFTSMAKATRYYLQARANATTNEQRALCTFMLSKCKRNEYYNAKYKAAEQAKTYYEGTERPPAGEYFAELKDKYAGTAYYKEVLEECEYFRHYVNKRQPAGK